MCLIEFWGFVDVIRGWEGEYGSSRARCHRLWLGRASVRCFKLNNGKGMGNRCMRLLFDP